MKTAGIALVWFGVIALLKNMGLIRIVDWSIIWPVLVIIAGFSCRYREYSMLCGMGVKCGMCKGGKCDTSAEHKCEGADCGTCK